MALPKCFCWTRFGTEAAQPIEDIVLRKEQERIANSGIFLWGVGNAIGPSVKELVRRYCRPQVLFSPIRSSPQLKDVRPPAVVVWALGQTLDGGIFCLPEHSLVTSRHDPAAPRGRHYALVCHSHTPLLLSRSDEKVTRSGLRNLLTGRPVGASQVTAVVRRGHTEEAERPIAYEVAMRAELVYPYFIRLRHPKQLPNRLGTGGLNPDQISDALRWVRQQGAGRVCSGLVQASGEAGPV